MAETTPAVRGEILVWLAGGEERRVTVGSPAWQSWLLTANKFTYSSARGSFTAYKEPRKRGGLYWKAYRRRAGKKRRAYLGKDEQLTLQRLNDVAVILAADECHPVAQALPDRIEVKRSPANSAWSAVGPPCLDQQGILLSTKLSPPPVGPDLLERPRLTQLLCEGLKHRLTLVVAPAGFGKTSLLGQWLQQEQRQIAWLSLDAGDNDSARFWGHVIAALQTQRPHLGDAALTLLRSLDAPPTRSVLTVLSNEITVAAKDVALVLDDFHLIEDQAIHSGVSFLLDCAPPLLHLVIASRSTPPFPLSRLRGRGQLVEVAENDLRFTPEETATFLNDFKGLRLSAEDIAALEKRSDGWIVMLHLAALSMQGRDDPSAFIKSFAGDSRYVMDFLIEEVLSCQPEGVQTFLQQTSILPRLNGSLCEAITGLPEGEGQVMLEALERAHLLTLPVDSERGWYRYHMLLASALSARLHQTQPGLVPELHRRAFRWYAERNLPVEAIDHALVAGEVESAARLIDQTTLAMQARGQMGTILGWLPSVPDDLVRVRPLHCIWHALALLATGRPDLAESRLRDAELLIRLAADGAARTTRDGSAAEVMALGHLGFVQATQGHLRRAETTYREALTRTDERTGSRLEQAASPLFGLAMLNCEWNNLSSAERYAKTGIELAHRGEISHLQRRGQWVLSHLKLAEGDVEGALEMLRQSEQMALKMNLSWELDRIAAFRARLWLAKGDVQAARDWARASGLSADDDPRDAPEAMHRILAQVLIASGEPAKALRLLERLLHATTSGERMGSAVKILALRAVALRALGKTAESLSSLERALSVAAPERYARSFVDLGAPMAALLSGLAEEQRSGRASGISTGYVKSLLGALESRDGRRRRTGDGTVPGPASFESLSPREIEVVRLIAGGWSASQIAQELIVSHNTIKTHCKNIYARLGVHTRAEVIAKAKALRLV